MAVQFCCRRVDLIGSTPSLSRRPGTRISRGYLTGLSTYIWTLSPPLDISYRLETEQASLNIRCACTRINKKHNPAPSPDLSREANLDKSSSH